MAITNGYCTLAEVKARLMDDATYTASTLSFTASTKTIADTAYGLKMFQAGDIIQVSGTDDNDGFYTVATGDTAATLITSEALTDEAVGDTVTITVANYKTNDTSIESAIEAVSRLIDAICGRFFYSQTDTARYYTAVDYEYVFTDDIQSGTGNTITLNTDNSARTYSDTWAATDYDLLPYNAAADGWPYTWIEITPQGSYTFPEDTKKGVKITADWGWATVPNAIKEACILYSSRVFKRGDALFGVLGSPGAGELRGIMERDPDAMLLMNPYIKRVVGNG